MTPTLSGDQQAIADAGLLYSPSVLSLPTGGGKTWLARLAIRYSLDRGFKAVYLSPLRAIARELSLAWRDEFPNHRVGLYTGEMGVDDPDGNPLPAEADIILATPEKFDLYCRTWNQQLHWLSRIDLLVVDEAHTLAGGRRGATLEGIITRLKVINPYARVMALSATLGNPMELADWLGGKSYVSRNRPIPLKWRIRTHTKTEHKADVVVDEAKTTIHDGGQMIVFVQSRPRTESLVKRLAESGITAVAHHAGLSKDVRDKAEAAYRSGSIRVLIATPTLSMGVNLPARTVVLHDLQRWDSGAWVNLTTNEVWQLAGRAGRPGLDASGEVVLISPAWNQKAARQYMIGKFEPICSELIGDLALSEQVLVTFGSRMALHQEQAERILAGSLYAQGLAPGFLKKRVDKAVSAMVSAEMLERNEDGYIRATRLGRIATRFQLTPRTVIAWNKFENALPNATLFDLLVAICASPDFTARMRVDHNDVVMLQSAFDREAMHLRLLGITARHKLLGTNGKDLIAAVRTALCLRAWTRLGELDETAIMFGAMEHEVEEARKEMVRMLQAFAALVSAKPRQVAGKGVSEEPGLVEKACALSAMVCAGLDDEQATLALVDGIGPVIARRMGLSGFADIEALAQADPLDVAKVDGVSLNRAQKWVDEAGNFISKGGAARYREVFVTPVNTGTLATVLPGLDYYRWMRASGLKVDVNGASWTVSGGNEPHLVTRDSRSQYQCNCADAKRVRLCKHRLAVMHLEGESGIPRFTDDFPKETGVFDLEYEWSHQDVGAAKWK